MTTLPMDYSFVIPSGTWIGTTAGATGYYPYGYTGVGSGIVSTSTPPKLTKTLADTKVGDRISIGIMDDGSTTLGSATKRIEATVVVAHANGDRALGWKNGEVRPTNLIDYYYVYKGTETASDIQSYDKYLTLTSSYACNILEKPALPKHTNTLGDTKLGDTVSISLTESGLSKGETTIDTTNTRITATVISIDGNGYRSLGWRPNEPRPTNVFSVHYTSNERCVSDISNYECSIALVSSVPCDILGSSGQSVAELPLRLHNAKLHERVSIYLMAGYPTKTLTDQTIEADVVGIKADDSFILGWKRGETRPKDAKTSYTITCGQHGCKDNIATNIDDYDCYAEVEDLPCELVMLAMTLPELLGIDTKPRLVKAGQPVYAEGSTSYLTVKGGNGKNDSKSISINDSSVASITIGDATASMTMIGGEVYITAPNGFFVNGQRVDGKPVDIAAPKADTLMTDAATFVNTNVVKDLIDKDTEDTTLGTIVMGIASLAGACIGTIANQSQPRSNEIVRVKAPVDSISEGAQEAINTAALLNG